MFVATLYALLICHVGGPGTTTQAQPIVDKFLRQVESVIGWKNNSLIGSYFTNLDNCRQFLNDKKPTIGAFDLATYLKQAKDWKLKAVAHMGKADAKRYYLLVREGSYKDLSSLKGKTLISSLTSDPVFLSKIIFEGKVDATKHFVLVGTKQPLKGIRKVARGQADATLVDESAYKYLSEIDLPTKLKAIYMSPSFPGLTLAVINANSNNIGQLTTQLTNAIPKLCAGAGESLCKNFNIQGFVKVTSTVYQKLLKKYR